MKKVFFLNSVFILLILISFQTPAQTVFEDELRTAGTEDTVVFKNYTGPHKKIDSIEQIIGIGRFLGEGVGREVGTFNYFEKYSIIHAVDYTVTEGLDADILILSPEAAVDHIVNLRRIISGYLESAYGYRTDQAEVLSIFITVYNAVHRKDIDYFNEKYKKIVLSYLTAEKAGLALTYSEWPGNTMIVIPLTPQAGTGVLGDLDSDVLSGGEVVERLREDDGQGIEPRREMVELKEDEIVEQRQEIQAEREQLSREEEELTSQMPDLGEEEKVEAEEKLAEIADAKAALDQREQQVEQREERIVAEREAIAEDQMEEISREPSAPAVETASARAAAAPGQSSAAEPVLMPFLLLRGGPGAYTGRLLLIDPETGRIVKRSDIDSIRLRGYRYSADEIISVAGESGGNRIVSIVRIDPGNLEIIQSGTVEVYIDSALVKSGGSYYAVVNSDDGWKIGVFNKDLMLRKISSADVYPATEIYLRGNDVVVQTSSGEIIRITPDGFTDVP